ncbi:hypothetical protein [Streptomyces griseorubiginosus]|uniref:hypothetical protein n=1 Tax=Streptomyces griseorubiginosus TaxID=67304 RepID=UPI002E816635|nr:hypothetical protein [Streptomyces griseorubiginosus]WUB45444.1 hypothetical protein OHN19_19640 [Streptomyces griseorubiginosus]WUB53962.1 hypothetical protein OG942_19640 [Streptomyces griseorubiginosus]
MNLKRRNAAVLATTFLAASAVTGIAPSAQAAEQACTYQAAYLPVPEGIESGSVTATGGAGVYAGEVQFPGDDSLEHAVLWTDGRLTDLGPAAGADFDLYVSDVNSAGTVVGHGAKITGVVEGFPNWTWFPVRSRDGKLEQLPVPAGSHDVQTRVVTENGDIYGDGYGADPNYREVYKWPADQPGTVVKPAGFPKGSKVEGVDTDGTVAVTAEDAPRGTWRPYLWKNGTARQLPIPTGAAHAQVTGISNGNVIGDALTADFARSAVVWNKDGRAAALPNGQGTTAINSQGLILGSNKRLVASLWQLTASAGAAPADGVLSTLGDDGSLAGAKARPGASYPRFPAVWRCG